MTGAAFDFPKQNRLLTASEYKRVFDHSEFKVSTRYFLILARSNNLEQARLGLIVAKKNSKRAVDRNRLKRFIRDRFRHHKEPLRNLDAIVLTRRDTDQLSNSQLIRQLDQLWSDLAGKRSRKQQSQ